MQQTNHKLELVKGATVSGLPASNGAVPAVAEATPGSPEEKKGPASEKLEQSQLWPDVTPSAPTPAAKTSPTGSFGPRLRRERELRGIKLQDVADATKISKRHLTELEEERFKDLPGGIFNKGFVRAYARYLGIDEEQAIADYQAALGQATPSSEDAAVLESIAEAKKRSGQLRRDRAPLFMVAAVVLVLALGGVGLYKFLANKQAPANQTAINQVANITPAQTPAVSTAASVPAELATPSAPIQLRVSTKEESWIQVTADDRLIHESVMTAGTEQTFDATESLSIKVGNAAGVKVVHNDKSTYEFAPGSKLRTLTFTPEGIVR